MYQISKICDESLFSNLLAMLQSRPLDLNRFRKNSGLGRSQCFGIVKQRDGSYHGSRYNYYRMDILDALQKLAPQILPDGFDYDGIQVNDNYQTQPHKDKGNRGISAIVGFGDYIGGELIIEETKVDIHHKVCMFDGSLYTHSTAPWTGQRYSLVFFKVDRDFKIKPIYYITKSKNGTLLLTEEIGDVLRIYDKNGSNIYSSDKEQIIKRFRKPTLTAAIEN